MEAVVARYLSVRRLTDRPGTIRHIDAALRQLIAWLARTSPSLDTFAEVTRDHLLAYAEALNTEPNPRTKQPIALGPSWTYSRSSPSSFKTLCSGNGRTSQVIRSCIAGDLPKRPLRVPRYIPRMSFRSSWMLFVASPAPISVRLY